MYHGSKERGSGDTILNYMTKGAEIMSDRKKRAAQVTTTENTHNVTLEQAKNASPINRRELFCRFLVTVTASVGFESLSVAKSVTTLDDVPLHNDERWHSDKPHQDNSPHTDHTNHTDQIHIQTLGVELFMWTRIMWIYLPPLAILIRIVIIPMVTRIIITTPI
jgi:hypothetical protein